MTPSVLSILHFRSTTEAIHCAGYIVKLSEKSFSRILSNFLLRNVLLFSLVLGLDMVILTQYFPDLHQQRIVWAIINLTFMYGWIMFHNKMLLERMLISRKKTIFYLISLAAGSGIWLTVSRFTTAQGNFPYQQNEVIVGFVLYTLFGASIFLSLRYFQSRSEFYQVSVLKREVELNQLKAQLNPHFLFNALNNIYSYNLENHTHGNDLILKLSQLMRFAVESTRQSLIPVSEEINFLQNYIAFEKERLGYRCRIWYTKNITFPDRMIPPLILFPLVENAFKHGTNTMEETEVDISISDKEDTLSLSVHNEIMKNDAISTKAGLSNTVRRLNLLFPGKHFLQTRSDSRFYDVKLTLLFTQPDGSHEDNKN